jgi:DMSO/TMAO reductase YedYZ molybdopterin-dependent catalytic subunit
MKYLIAILFLGTLTSCTSRSVVPENPFCKSVKSIDKWSFTDAPPSELKDYEKIKKEGHVAYWFSNSKNEYLMCTRPKESSGCGEEIRQFELKNGKWEQKMGLTITICK